MSWFHPYPASPPAPLGVVRVFVVGRKQRVPRHSSIGGKGSLYSKQNQINMASLRGRSRRFLADRSVAALLALQIIITGAVIAFQTTSFNDIAYYLGIVPEIAIIITTLAGEATPLPGPFEAAFPVSLILLLASYYLVAVVLAAPGRAIYQAAK